MRHVLFLALVIQLGLISFARARESMIASWYAARASDVCAHKTLPFGTRLLLFNPLNGHKVACTVDDRGPFIRGRSLDVSHVLAVRLGFIHAGIVRLIVTILPR